MDKKELHDVLKAAYDSGDFTIAKAALDEWEGANERSRTNLSFLRFHREQLDQTESAVCIAIEMLQHQTDAATQMSDQLSLGRLYLQQGQDGDAWDCVSIVLDWQELPDYFSVGMARDAVELCMEIAIATADGSLASTSFDAGMSLLEAGSSVSPRGLSKASEAAQNLKQLNRLKAYCESLEEIAD